jgi:hypothetical protein
MAAGLGQSAYRVHCRCTQPNHEVTRTINVRASCCSTVRCAIGRRISGQVGHTVQFLGINLVTLAIAVRDGSQLANVGYDDLVS